MKLNNLFKNRYQTPVRQEFSKKSLIPIILFGLIFIGAGLSFIGGSLFIGDKETVIGTVVDIKEYRGDDGMMYTPVVSYEVNGSSYRVPRNFSSSNRPSVGKEYSVAYPADNPADGKVLVTTSNGEFWMIGLFPLIGIIVVATFIYAYIKSLRRTKEIDRLLASGNRLDGVLVDIRSAGSNTKNRNPVYQLVVLGNDPHGQVKEYVSDKIVGFPASLMFGEIREAAIPIDVFVDPANFDNYYVDLADVPSITPERITELVKNARGEV